MRKGSKTNKLLQQCSSPSSNSIPNKLFCNSLNIYILLIFFTISGCQQKIHIISGKTMGTSYSIKYTGTNNITKTEIDNRLTAINKIMSNWDENSEISKLNNAQISKPIKISAELFFVLKEAKKAYNKTDGYFDVTIGNLIETWGFGIKKIINPPSYEKIKNVNFGQDNLILKANKVTKLKNININLSAIAKGYAVDEIAKLLKTKNINNFLVEIGGEIKASGSKFDKNWKIAIEPLDGNIETIYLDNNAVATSGDYRNFIIWGNKKYPHILNPKTSKPVVNNLVSITVINQSAMLADIYATAFMAMGYEKAKSFAYANNIKVFFILRNNKNLISKSVNW